MTDEPKKAKDMTAAEFAAAKREVIIAARSKAREPKPSSFSRGDRNLQEAPSQLGGFSAHDLKPDEHADLKRKLIRLDYVTEGRQSQARQLARIKERQDSRKKS
ncbi:MAG: hypothetical protein QOF32_1446 [Gammaproteobacteria bacterium]|jgi:hypothetical protein|nr:hypothetical protein [Gammaproteobacteria bacterium]